MPRKTKKQKLRAHTHTVQLPKKENKIVQEANEQQTAVTVSTSSPTLKKEQLPLVPLQKKRDVQPLNQETTSYFRKDIRKTAFLTGGIVILEIILYQLMQNGTLERLIPALKI